MKLAIGTWPFGAVSESPPIEFSAVLNRAAELGFDGVEFAPVAPHPDLLSYATSKDRKQLMTQITKRGLEVSAVVRFIDKSILSEPHPATYMDEFERTLSFCTDLAVTRMWLCTGDAPDMVNQIGYDVAFDRLVRTWGECARKAAAVGVTLVWEFEIGSAFNESQQVVDVAHALAGPGFGVLYDTAHGHLICDASAKGAKAETAGDGQIELLRQLRGTIKHVHLGDSAGSLTTYPASSIGYFGADRVTATHVPLGRGDVPFDRILPTLRDAAVGAEWWCVDLAFCPNAWEAIEESKMYVDRHVIPLVS